MKQEEDLVTKISRAHADILFTDAVLKHTSHQPQRGSLCFGCSLYEKQDSLLCHTLYKFTHEWTLSQGFGGNNHLEEL